MDIEYFNKLLSECRESAKEKVDESEASESKLSEQGDKPSEVEEEGYEILEGPTPEGVLFLQKNGVNTKWKEDKSGKPLNKPNLEHAGKVYVYVGEVQESKLTEEDETDETPPPPQEVKEPNADEDAPEMRKEYLGKSEDTHYYFVTMEGEEGEVSDFVIVDQEGVKRYSAKEHNIEVSEKTAAEFIIQAIRDVDIQQIERNIFMKYIFPKLEEESPEEEEIIEKPEKVETPEKEKEEAEEAEDEEEEKPVESRELGEGKHGARRAIVHTIVQDILSWVEVPVEGIEKVINILVNDSSLTDKIKLAQDMLKESKALSEMKVTDPDGNSFDVHISGADEQSTTININGKDFNFSNEFASIWRDDEGVLSDEGLKELALDALANMEEDEYSELVAGTEEEQGEDKETDPYLLSGEELERAEDAAKRGEGQYKAKVENKVEETDWVHKTPGRYKVTFYDGHLEELDAESKVDAKQKAEKVYPKSRVSQAELLQQTGQEEDVKLGSKVEEGKIQRGKRDGTGPYKDSAQRSISDVGRRKKSGEKCPNESEESETEEEEVPEGAVESKQVKETSEDKINEAEYVIEDPDPELVKLLKQEVDGGLGEFDKFLPQEAEAAVETRDATFVPQLIIKDGKEVVIWSEVSAGEPRGLETEEGKNEKGDDMDNKLLEEFYAYMEKENVPTWKEGLEEFAKTKNMSVEDLKKKISHITEVKAEEKVKETKEAGSKDAPEVKAQSKDKTPTELKDNKETSTDEGKTQRGKRDGTGPYKDSAQRSISDVGRRKQAGEVCPKESEESGQGEKKILDISELGDDELVAKYEERLQKLDWAQETGAGEVYGSDLYQEVANMAKEIRRRGLEIGESKNEVGANKEVKEEIDILNDDVQSGLDDMYEGIKLDEAKQKKMVSKKGKSLSKTAKVRNRGDCVFPQASPKVEDNKDHFPINKEGQARNALARANQYKSAPKWYKGSLESLVKAVARVVHKKYPDIKVSKAAEVPGKGPKESKIQVESQIDISESKAEQRLHDLLGL